MELLKSCRGFFRSRPGLIRPRGGDGKRRLHKEDIRRRQALEGLENLSPATAHGRMAANEKRDVGSHRRRQALQCACREFRFEKLVECHKHCRRIAAPATQAGTVGNVFLKMDLHTEPQAGVLRKDRRRAVGEVRGVGGHARIATGQAYAGLPPQGDLQTVRQGDRSHEGFDLVKSILPPPEHPEREVDFGRGVNCHAGSNYPRMHASAKEKIIVAVDAPDAPSALRLVEPLAKEGCLFKIGLQLFTAEGPSIIAKLQATGARIFLDLKFHDIPNTAREAVHSAVRLGVDMTTIHLCGGSEMVSESIAAAVGSKTLVLGVSVLTSMDDESLRAVGVPRAAEEQVLHLAEMGLGCGLRGIVASPREIRPLREKFGNSLVIVTPGVRPAGSDVGDQKRIMTPSDAVRAGADYLVIGRPITGASSPLDSLRAIAEEMQAVL